MAYGIVAGRKIAFGLEATAGTPVAASKVWRGTGLIDDDMTIEWVDEYTGDYIGLGHSYVPLKHAIMNLDETTATFEQLPILLAACIEDKVAGSQTDGVGPYIYQYDIPITAANAIKTYTIEAGDNVRADEMEYSFVDEMTLSGAGGEAVMVAATLFGRQATDAEFTGAATVDTVEEILFSKGRLYIDTTTIGTTIVTAGWLGFNLTIPSGWKEIVSGDGNLYFSALKFIGHKDRKITGELILEHDDVGVAEVGFAKARTARKIRMTFYGNAVTTQGTTIYTWKMLNIDAVIKYTDVPELGDQEGDDIVTLPFEVIYDNSSLAMQVKVVNNLDAVISAA